LFDPKLLTSAAMNASVRPSVLNRRSKVFSPPTPCVSCLFRLKLYRASKPLWSLNR